MGCNGELCADGGANAKFLNWCTSTGGVFLAIEILSVVPVDTEVLLCYR